VSIRDIFCISLYVLSKCIKILPSKLPLMVCNYMSYLSSHPSFSDILFVHMACSCALVVYLVILLICYLFRVFGQSVF
jgi:hypothetical protein